MAAQIFGNQNKSYLEGLLRNSNNSWKAFSYEAITVDGTVQNLTIPDGARYAFLILESDAAAIAARWLTTAQTTVAAGVGFPISNGVSLEVIDTQNLTTFQIIEEAANTTVLHVEYYK